MKLLAVLSLLISLASHPAAAELSAAAPNVILILADDLGYETLGANGGTSYPTPVLDRLAAGGARFTDCFAQPLCTPTRVQLMTGLSNARNYLNFGNMDPKSVTFANHFQEGGLRDLHRGQVAARPGSGPPGEIRLRRPLSLAAHPAAAALRQPGARDQWGRQGFLPR